ncbi:hypothetical protein [Chondromyces apiculatus]|uniref:Uncharacterized protein n=1 Tax=Chondromyces apiculatus DSM 436 TaxID=1192034 RepID=A0A017SYP8_9BACT|nr:hypothetical protein [Chondromyces apiculatus]EYF01907.1 Hypothetical protein CAP_7675 [Chondromyces apiculatus DSM 436]
MHNDEYRDDERQVRTGRRVPSYRELEEHFYRENGYYPGRRYDPPKGPLDL